MSDIGRYIYEKTTTIAFLTQRTRLWSRLGVLCYLYLFYQMVSWVFTLPDITSAQTIIVGVVVGMSTPISAFYLRSGQELYQVYANMQYSNRWIAMIDHLGYIIDRFRIFPLIMMGFYGMVLFQSLGWAMGLGADLSMQQAAFLTTLSSASTFVFGFFVSSGEVNMQLEEVYERRHGIEHDREASDEIEEIIKQHTKES